MLRQRLPGQDLVWNGQRVGMLTQLSASDWVRQRYTEASRAWSTVTPVVLPGHDDRDDRKAERLLRKAFVDAGFSQALVDRISGAGLAWRPVGFRAGVEPASRYCLPDHMTGPRYHVRVEFPHRIRGPLAIGAGRYRGMGLFAADE